MLTSKVFSLIFYVVLSMHLTYFISLLQLLVIRRDVGGVWTIGYGNTMYQDGSPVRQGDTITQQGADDLFEFWVDESVSMCKVPFYCTRTFEDYNNILLLN